MITTAQKSFGIIFIQLENQALFRLSSAGDKITQFKRWVYHNLFFYLHFKIKHFLHDG